MLQVKTVIHRNVEQRLRESMILVRQFSRLKFKRLSRREEGYFRHCNYSGIRAAYDGALEYDDNSVFTEQELRERLRKISALFEGATTPGERNAAAAAIDRVKKSLAGMQQTEPTMEMQFSLPDRWQRRLFGALCRRYGLEPYRYKRQRYTTVMVRAPQSFVDRTLWPEYQQIKGALDEYLNEATERIIREEVFGDAGEAGERRG